MADGVTDYFNNGLINLGSTDLSSPVNLADTSSQQNAGYADTGTQTIPVDSGASPSAATVASQYFAINPNAYSDAFSGFGSYGQNVAQNATGPTIVGDSSYGSKANIDQGVTTVPGNNPEPTLWEKIGKIINPIENFASTHPKTADLIGSSVLAGLGELLTGKNRKTLEIMKQKADAETLNAQTSAAHVANLEAARQNALGSTGTALNGYKPVGAQTYNPVAMKRIQNQGLIAGNMGG